MAIVALADDELDRTYRRLPRLSPGPNSCAYCLLPTVVVTVEQLVSLRGEVIASTVVAKDRCTTEGCVGSRSEPR